MQKAKKEQAGIILLWCAVIGLALCSLGYFVLKTVADGLWRVDIDTYWHNTAYAIRGYDLNRTAHGAIVVDSVGPMRSAIIMPWGRLVELDLSRIPAIECGYSILLYIDCSMQHCSRETDL